MNIEKLMQNIKTVKPGRYDCSIKDIASIRDAVGGGALDTGANCYLFGFIQGQKAAKAEARREKKERLERDTSGWYGFLSRWLERNIDDEKLLQKLGTRARVLEGLLKEHEQ